MKCIITSIIFLMFSESSLANVPKAGTYAGFIHMDGAKDKIATRLEVLFFEDILNSTTHVISFLKINLGGFWSTEYVAQFYQTSGDYNFDSNIFVLSGNEKGNSHDVSLINGRVLDKGFVIQGEIQVASSSRTNGTIDLIHLQAPKALARLTEILGEYKLTPSITGNYLGHCGEDEFMLQLEATKKYGFSSQDQLPLHGYIVTGRKAYKIKDKDIYLMRPDYNFNDAFYDFYAERITFPHLDKECSINSSGIHCEKHGCFLSKARGKGSLSELFGEGVNEAAQLRRLTKAPKIDSMNGLKEEHPIGEESLIKEVQGSFEGFLSVDGRGDREALDLNVFMSSTPQDESTVKGREVSILAKIKMENNVSSSTGLLSFRYVPEVIRDLRRGMVVVNEENVLKINHWSRNLIEGSMYSKSFGKIGNFSVVRGRNIRREYFPSQMVSSALSGNFQASHDIANKQIHLSKQQLSLRLMHDSSLGPKYYPFKIEGKLNEIYQGKNITSIGQSKFPHEAKVTKSYRIKDFRYDPFSGVVAFEFEENFILVGRYIYGFLNLYRSPTLAFSEQIDPQQKYSWFKDVGNFY